jgi:hypothetical protein
VTAPNAATTQACGEKEEEDAKTEETQGQEGPECAEARALLVYDLLADAPCARA